MIIRVAPRRQYTTVPAETIRDSRLSLAALGLLVRLLSRPDSWVFRMPQLQKECRIGKDGLQALKRELVAAGYMTSDHRVRGPGGQFVTETVVYETSIIPQTGGAVDPQPVGVRKNDPPTTTPAKAKDGKATTRERVDGGGPGPSDLDAKTDIDEYVELGTRYGGKLGAAPENPAGWEKMVRARLLAAGGLTPAERDQLATWERKRDHAKQASAKSRAEAEEARAVAESRQRDEIYDALPPDERQSIDDMVCARLRAAGQDQANFFARRTVLVSVLQEIYPLT